MRHRILIVDDEPYILRILSFKLQREGYITFEAVSAEEAEAVLGEHQVDLMFPSRRQPQDSTSPRSCASIPAPRLFRSSC